MKTMVSLMWILALMAVSCSSKKQNPSAEFWVRGNCDMCKERIETTLKGQPGVVSAEWNVDSKMVKVEYDSTQTNQPKLEQACAAVGHETKTVEDDSTAYQALPKCCKKPEDR